MPTTFTGLNDPTPYSGQFNGNTRAAFAAMLKIWYAKRWDDWVHEATYIMQKLAKRGDRMGGLKVQTAVVTEFPQSGGVTSRENRGLASARGGAYIQPEISARDFYLRLAWSGQVQRAAAAGDKAAFAKPRMLDIQNARKQADINMCRKLYLGYADVLAGVVSTAGQVVTLYSRNARTSSGEAYWYAGRFYCRRNQSVGHAATPLGVPDWDIEGGSTGVVDEEYISAVGGTTAAPTITYGVTIAGNITAPVLDDVLIPFHNRALSGYSAATTDINFFSSFNGIGNICTDDSIYSALYGLDKTASGNEPLKGVYNANGGTTRAYREREFSLLVDRIRDEGIGEEIDTAIMHASTRREVVAEHDGDRRYAPVQSESGFAQLLTFVGDKGIPLTSDWMCQPAMVVALNTGKWSWLEQSPMGPLGTERWVSGFDQDEMIWHKSGNIECQDPFNQGIHDDVDIDVYAVNS